MVVVALAHAETVEGVVVEAEARVSENRGSCIGIDSDGSGNIGIGGSDGNGGQQQQQQWQPKQGQWWQRQ